MKKANKVRSKTKECQSLLNVLLEADQGQKNEGSRRRRNQTLDFASRKMYKLTDLDKMRSDFGNPDLQLLLQINQVN